LNQLLGIALLVVGAYLYDQSGLLDDDIIPLLDKIGVGTITLGDLLRVVCIIVIILGTFITIVSILGDVGAIFKLRPILVIVSIYFNCGTNFYRCFRLGKKICDVTILF